METNQPITGYSATKDTGYQAGFTLPTTQSNTPTVISNSNIPPKVLDNQQKFNTLSQPYQPKQDQQGNTQSNQGLYGVDQGTINNFKQANPGADFTYEDAQNSKQADLEQKSYYTPESQSILSGIDSLQTKSDDISKQYLDRIKETYRMAQEDQKLTNSRVENSVRSMLAMGGSSASGSDSNSLLNETIKEGQRSLNKLSFDEQGAYLQALDAKQKGDERLFDKKVSELQTIRNAKIEDVQKYNEKVQAQAEKLKEEKIQAQKEQVLADLYSKGITDPVSLMKGLQAQGISMTAKDIQDTIASITPPGLDDLVKSLRSSGAPAEIMQKVLQSRTIDEAYKNAGSYATAGGTGQLGLYNNYAARAIAAGQTPVEPSVFFASMKPNGAGSIGGIPRTYQSDLDALIGNATNTISTRFGQQTFANSIASARNDADKISTIATIVLKNAPAAERTDYNNQVNAIKQLDKAIEMIDNGVNTGVIQAGKQYVYNLAGKDYDPNLSKINQLITSAIQPYRNSITGAAWGEQEDNEYQQLFGSTKYSPQELKQRLEGVKEIMKEKTVGSLRNSVDPLSQYDNVFDPANNLIQNEEQAQKSFESFINANRSDEATSQEISNRLRDLKEVLGREPTASEYFEANPWDKPDNSNQSFNTVVGDTDPAKGIVGGINLKGYAVDPNQIKSVATIYDKVPESGDALDFDMYIKSVAPKSKITGQDILAASNTYQIDPKIILALMQHESRIGTSSVALANNNYGGITWSPTYQKNNPGAMKGTPRPANEGGYYVKFSTPREGLIAQAKLLSNRKIS